MGKKNALSQRKPRLTARLSKPKDAKTEARDRLADEIGTIVKDTPDRVALVYPSPYRAAMSSLGFQTIYREINSIRGRSAERSFLPDSVSAYQSAKQRLFTYETERSVDTFPVIAMSVAFELELAGVVQTLELSGLPPLARNRHENHPFVLGGGPLTFSNPLPLAPYVDAMLLGESDESVNKCLDIFFAIKNRTDALQAMAREIDNCFVPTIHGTQLPSMGRTRNELLPARAQITTPNTELRNMFLIEAERGCSRGCAYCVMRRSTNGGMRIVPKEVILQSIPDHAKRVGLVGAAVSDHPKICEIVEELAASGRQVGLSSLRPDRINDRFAQALRRGGYKTLTTASDGASQRVRDSVQRKARERHIEKAATLAKQHGFKRMKLYMMLGLPEERDEDVDELIKFSTELSKIVPLSLGIAPFVSKRNTPLDRQPYAGVSVINERVRRLREGVKGRVDLRSTSARWAWVEWKLAQGGTLEGEAVLEAVRNGGKFRDYERAFENIASRNSRTLPVMTE